LWAIKYADPELKGADTLPGLAANGRTSVRVDKELPKSLYRVVGYRVCGERAVRVDILERLADLIRPLLAWRAGAPGAKPAGAVDGSGFVVTGSMTSLTGTSGEDFASILRSLGYRMERRPKPPESPATPVQPSPITPEAGSDAADASTTAAPAAAFGPGEPELGAPTAPEAAPEDKVEASVATPEAIVATSDVAQTTVSVDKAAALEVVPPETAPAATGQSAEEMIEVWRPGRSEHRRGERARPRGQRRERTQERRDPAAAAASGKRPHSRPQSQAPQTPAGPAGRDDGEKRTARQRRPERERSRSSSLQPRGE